MKQTNSTIRNKRILDTSFYEFRRQLEYKCAWHGKTLSIIDKWFASTQICSCCGDENIKKDTDIREWKCEHCNTILDRDINASVNILNEGLKILTV